MAKYRNIDANFNFHFCCPMPGKKEYTCDEDTDVVVVPPGQTFEAAEDCEEVIEGLKARKIVKAG